MKRWEYILVDALEDTSENPVHRRWQLHFELQDQLNRYGAEGWEAVGTIAFGDDVRVLLRREVSDD